MAFYTICLIIISLIYLAFYNKKLRVRTRSFDGKEAWLFLCVGMMVLLWGLRDVSVGLDTASYNNLYDWALRAKLSQYDIYWIEPGYALLTMFSAQVLHLSFHQFLMMVSLFCGFSIYEFIKRYSLNWYISAMVFISFPFMAFYMSGIRNAIVISIVLLAVRLLEEKKASRIILYEAIVIAASFLFHRSGLICLAIPIFAYKKRSEHLGFFYVVLPLALMFGKKYIYQFISSNFKDVGEAGGISVGAAFFVFLCFFVLIVLLNRGRKQDRQNEMHGSLSINLLSSRLVYCSLIGALISNGASDILSRMIVFFQMFYMISIPNSIEESGQSTKAKNVTYLIVIFVLLTYFYVFVLMFDPYGIVPYSTY